MEVPGSQGTCRRRVTGHLRPWAALGANVSAHSAQEWRKPERAVDEPVKSAGQRRAGGQRLGSSCSVSGGTDAGGSSGFQSPRHNDATGAALIGGRQNKSEMAQWFAALPKLGAPDRFLEGLRHGLKMTNARNLQIPGAERVHPFVGLHERTRPARSLGSVSILRAPCLSRPSESTCCKFGSASAQTRAGHSRVGWRVVCIRGTGSRENPQGASVARSGDRDGRLALRIR